MFIKLSESLKYFRKVLKRFIYFDMFYLVMKKKVIISSFFSANTIYPLLRLLSPTKIILVVEENLSKLDSEDAKKKRESLNEVKQKLDGIVGVEILETKSLYDLYEIAKVIVEKIDTLADSEVILNISEGRKPLSFGMYFGGSARREKINSICYLIKENNEILKLPFPDFKINGIQKIILKKLEKKSTTIKDLRKEILKIRTKSVFYKYLKELEKEGYIKTSEEKVELTDTGRIVLL